MSPQRPETDPRALAHRAAEEFATGGYLAAQTAALVAIAVWLTAKPAECTCPPWGNPDWPHRHGCPAAESEQPPPPPLTGDAWGRPARRVPLDDERHEWCSATTAGLACTKPKGHEVDGDDWHDNGDVAWHTEPAE